MSSDSYRTTLLREQCAKSRAKAVDASRLLGCLDQALACSILVDRGLVPGRTIATNSRGDKFVIDQAFETSQQGVVNGWVYMGYKIRKDGSKGVQHRLLEGVTPTQDVYPLTGGLL